MRGADSVKNERQSGENEREEREIIKNTKWREREKKFLDDVRRINKI